MMKMKRLILSVILLSISVMACGMPVHATIAMPASVNKEVYTYPTPEVSTTSTTHVTICGRWNIRPAAGDLAGHLGWLEEGVETVKVPATVTEDMGMWYELADGRGWVNARAICKK